MNRAQNESTQARTASADGRAALKSRSRRRDRDMGGRATGLGAGGALRCHAAIFSILTCVFLLGHVPHVCCENQWSNSRCGVRQVDKHSNKNDYNKSINRDARNNLKVRAQNHPT